MVYNFDEDIRRLGSESSKWDKVLDALGREDVIPMGTADMDFRCPEPIVNAVIRRAQHGVYGYDYVEKAFYDVTVDWLGRRHGWKIKPEWVLMTTGIVPVFHTSIQAFTDPGDEVLVLTPVYHAFLNAIRDNERVAASSVLLYENGSYNIDLADLQQRAASPKAKLMLMCSPHNPVGRVWTPEELRAVADICLKHNVVLVVDEIHSDLVFKGFTHYPLASLDARYEQNTISCYAPSKAFNTAGLRGSGLVIPNPDIKKRLSARFLRNKSILQNNFSVPSYIAAYTECDEYLDQLLPYLEANIAYVARFLADNMPKIRLVQPQATFLIWLDCAALELAGEELAQFFIREARIYLNGGLMFGQGGEHFVRMNVGCPRFRVRQAMEQLLSAYQRAGY